MTALYIFLALVWIVLLAPIAASVGRAMDEGDGPSVAGMITAAALVAVTAAALLAAGASR